MALTDILIPGGDPQCGLLEIPYASSGTPFDALNDESGIEEIILIAGGSGNTYSKSRIVNQ
jgi:hypothetical protein